MAKSTKPSTANAARKNMNNSRPFSDITVWSNLFFLIPVGFSVYLGIYVHAGIALVAIYTSIQYHMSHERQDRIIDRFMAIALMLANFWLCLAGGLELGWAALIIVLSIAAFYFRHRDNFRAAYTTNHVIWHLLSVCITLVSLLVYYRGL